MTERKTNWLAIAASAVAGMFIGFLWYGAIFQQQWMAGNGITMEGEKFLKNGAEMDMSATPMIFNTIAMVVYALLINWLVGKAGSKSWMDGAMVGGAVGLIGLIGVYIGNIFAGNPSSLSMVDGSYNLVVFTLMGAILGGWQKK
ncbi:MAG: DUF1761 domain-containing protein [Saprospiraceae bacterium]|nr:DUF1761 domain-containing protein [Saprospiraceae bacterium]